MYGEGKSGCWHLQSVFVVTSEILKPREGSHKQESSWQVWKCRSIFWQWSNSRCRKLADQRHLHPRAKKSFEMEAIWMQSQGAALLQFISSDLFIIFIWLPHHSHSCFEHFTNVAWLVSTKSLLILCQDDTPSASPYSLLVVIWFLKRSWWVTPKKCWVVTIIQAYVCMSNQYTTCGIG